MPSAQFTVRMLLPFRPHVFSAFWLTGNERLAINVNTPGWFDKAAKLYKDERFIFTIAKKSLTYLNDGTSGWLTHFEKKMEYDLYDKSKNLTGWSKVAFCYARTPEFWTLYQRHVVIYSPWMIILKINALDVSNGLASIRRLKLQSRYYNLARLLHKGLQCIFSAHLNWVGSFKNISSIQTAEKHWAKNETPRSTAVHFQHWMKKKKYFSTNLGQFQMEHLQRLKYVYGFFF